MKHKSRLGRTTCERHVSSCTVPVYQNRSAAMDSCVLCACLMQGSDPRSTLTVVHS